MSERQLRQQASGTDCRFDTTQTMPGIAKDKTRRTVDRDGAQHPHTPNRLVYAAAPPYFDGNMSRYSIPGLI